MKKRFQRILAGTLAIVMMLTSFAFDWGNATEAEAAEEVQENVVAGDVLADVDFTEENIYDLDDKFVATEGTTDSTYKYWTNGEIGTTEETTNVAYLGDVHMDNPNTWLLNTAGYKLEYLVDNNTNTWMSTQDSWTDPDHTEIIEITFANGTFYKISKVSFNPRSGKYGIPQDFYIEIHDGDSWVKVAKETGYTTTGEWSADIKPIIGNKMRLVATKLGNTDNSAKYAVQMKEISAYGVACTNVALKGSVSMNSMAWIQNNPQVPWYSEDLLVNGERETSDQYVTTEEYSDQAHTESITVTFADGINYNINKVVFSPRQGTRGIPEDFIIEVGDGIDDWTTVANITGYKTTGDWTSIGFKPVKGNAVRITATKLGSSGSKYALQLRELEAYGWKCANVPIGAADMNIPGYLASGHPSSYLYDGNTSTWTATDPRADAQNNTETVTLTFAKSAYYEVSEISFYPYNGKYGIPENFIVEVFNGIEWVKVAEETGYTTTGTWSKVITPTVCNAVRLTATKLGQGNSAGTYALMLGEMSVYGTKASVLQPTTMYEDGCTTLLSLKDITVKNFKADLELLDFDSNNTAYGLYFGQENSSSIENAISVTPISSVAGGIQISGAKDGEVSSTAAISGFKEGVYDNLHTLHVEVVSNVLKTWWVGFEDYVLSAELPDSYAAGYISLYSKGSDEGGIKSFKVQEVLVRSGAASDFTQGDATVLDEQFVASHGTKGTNATVATEGVTQYWNMGGVKTEERVNAALTGTPVLDNPYTGNDTLNDDSTSFGASTAAYSSSDVPEGVNATITFNGNYKIDQVDFVWRVAAGAPVDFELQVLIGDTWTTIQNVTGFTTTELKWTKSIDPIICKGFRLHVTKLGIYENTYWLQLREMRAFGTPVSNAASGGTAVMNIPGYLASSRPSSYLYDGKPSTWTATDPRTDAQYNTEKVTLTFAKGAYYEISDVSFYPYDGKYGIPENFIVEVHDGTKWIKVAEETGYTTTGTWIKSITPTVCNAVRLTATKLGQGNTTGTYALMLGEISAYGIKADYLTTKEACANGNATMLTWKEKKLENFKAEIQMLDYNKSGLTYGLYFGQSDYGVVESGAVQVVPNASVKGGIYVGGTAKLDVSTSAYVDSSISSISGLNKNASGNYVRMNYDVPNYSEGTYDNLHTLNVEVIDGIIKVWWSGHEDIAWTIAAPEDYKGGYVSLYATGNDLGGVKNFAVYEILDKDIKTNVDMNVEVVGEYTVVTVNNDIAKGILKNSTLKGSLQFDSEKFEYCTTVITDSSADRHDNSVHNATTEGVSLDMTSYSANAVAKFYFKNITGELDFTDFAFNVESVTRTNKEVVSATTTEAVEYDYTGDNGVQDKLIDARDLVRAAKDNQTTSDVRNALVGIHEDNAWVTGVTGEVKDIIYVDATKGSYTGAGTAESPLSNLTLASYRVADGGIIHVVGDYALNDSEKTIGMGGKHITIAGENGNLILTGVSEIDVVGDLTFDNIGVTGITADPSSEDGKNATLNFYANGHHFVVAQNAEFTGYIKNIYAGNLGEMPLETTNMELYGGSYGLIYGGSRSVSTIIESTNLIIGGTVNHDNDFDEMDSSHKYNEFIAVYGGSQNGYIKGDTNVTIQDQAHISMVNGGGYGQSSIVAGTCNVYVNGGTTVGYYGGSLGGTVYNTNLVMAAGTTEQIFGGSWVSKQSGGNANITGNVNVTVTGGTVKRRIHGGCYNENVQNSILGIEYPVKGEHQTEFFVTGNITVTIGSGISFKNSESDSVISALSRHNINHNEEVGSLYLENDDLIDYVGNNSWSFAGFDDLYIAGIKQ